MSINRTLLAAFHSVAAAGGFTAAAHEQNVSQSTLSVHVGRLEKAYGCRLFFRRGRSIELTDTGRALYDLTSRQFEAERDAEAFLTGMESGLSGHLRIGAVSSNTVIPFLKTFLRDFPKSTMSLDLSNSERIIRDVAEGNLDVGMIGFPIADPRIEKITLSQEDLCLVVGSNHEWAGQATINLTELSKQTLILRERGSQTRQIIEEHLSTRAISPFRLIEINEWEAVRELVQENLGVAVVPENEAAAMPNKCKIRIRDLKMHLTQNLIFRSDRKELTTLKAFLEIVHRSESENSHSVNMNSV